MDETTITGAATPDIRIEAGFRPEHRREVAEGCWSAFARKLRHPLGPREKAAAFIERVLDPGHAISAVTAGGAFLGIAGFKTPNGAFIGGGITDLMMIYGCLSGMLRGFLLSALERPCAPGVLLMDGIFVKPSARGAGVGAALLRAIERRARADRMRQVRLDVIDANPRARALYEREGFVPGRIRSLGILGPVFGFSNATEMTKPVAV